MQGISFKLWDYKYKGSEIDRKFSLKNLEKEVYGQSLRVESQNHREFSWCSYYNPQKRFETTGKDLKKERSLFIEQLMKQEKNYLLSKKEKKKS